MSLETTDASAIEAEARARRAKTVSDIWEEVQREQAAFNRIIKWLVGLLIVAAAIAAAAAAASYFEFRDMQQAHRASIENARVLAKIDSGEAARERNRMTILLLDIRETAAASRAQADLVRRVARAIASDERDRLLPMAMAVARDHATGLRVNASTSQLIAAVIDEADAGRLEVPSIELDFLKAVKLDWNAPTGEAASSFSAIAERADGDLKAYANSALSRLYHANADSDNLGGDPACDRSIARADTAVALGLDAIGPLLWKGECLRKQGRSQEAYVAFKAAYDWYRANQTEADEALPIDFIRRVHHGVGTTLVALAAAGEVSAVENALSVSEALEEAEQRLQVAAALRVRRGEGTIGEVYTSENLGFVYLQRENWPMAIAHTKYVDDVVPLAWNLTVRHIAAKTIYQSIRQRGDAETGGLSRDQALTIACDAQAVLSAMKYEYFDEDELRRLLPARYDDDVDRLIARPKAEFERRKDEARSQAIGVVAAAPTTFVYDADEDICL